MIISSYIKIIRPSQWLKNLLLYFPPFLGGVLLRDGVFGEGVVPFFSFCFAASSAYVLNDICDRKHDLHHPQKRTRPIPAGIISVPSAYLAAAILLIASLLTAISISQQFLMLIVGYIIVSVFYSLKLKTLPVLDLFCISGGFLLRLVAGGEAFGVIISEWLFLSVFLLSIFLSAGKRLSERNSLGVTAGAHRKSLTAYPEGFLDGTMFLTGASVLVTYAMYVISRHTLLYTIPVCAYGLLRYIFRVKSGEGGDPTDSLLRDSQLFFVGLTWAIMVGWSIYK